MVREFKKTGVATALTGALLAAASMSSHATVQLSAPGDVVLVPYVTCDLSNSVNTLVGLITVYKDRLGLATGNPSDPYWPAPAGLAGLTPSDLTASPTPPATSRSSTTRTLHWYFYNSRSEHKLDGIIPVTDNDFVRFDWCTTIKTLGAQDLSGVDGYMIFLDNDVDRSASVPVPSFALYGHSYRIQGQWETQAFIPVLSSPVYSFVGTTRVPNVVKRGGYPAFNRLVSGTDYTSQSSGLQRDIYMRYFLDNVTEPKLAVGNAMVFWFNTNQDTLRAAVPGETYDSEQNYLASFSVALKNELNILVSTPAKPAFPGMLHQETETYGSKFTVVNTGIVRFGIPEVQSAYPFTSSGVAFNLLGLAPDGDETKTQLQTEMATEGEDYLFQ
ncbi:MAG TPA: hypothetical protein PK708_10905 [Candidatus Competibacter sp.]|nr:hypothetical protein [Candidatus Competibacter sp.]